MKQIDFNDKFEYIDDTYLRCKRILKKTYVPNYDPEYRKLLTSERELYIINLLWNTPSSEEDKEMIEYMLELSVNFGFILTDAKRYPIVKCKDKELQWARLVMVRKIQEAFLYCYLFLGRDIPTDAGSGSMRVINKQHRRG